jgi:signal transduction histidine kinase
LLKIQIFISRIESQEFLESSAESTLEYFNRIKSTAKRMQNLMSDLVDYTRTVKGDRVFEQVHLNAIFEDIKEELAFTIEEKNAKIFIDEMPVVLGTQFQIQQLFINLISNAVKYVRFEVNPIIFIKLENFTPDLVKDCKVSNKEYYKITVTDNGIGFDQQYADKVFMLFKRLETDYNYKGTGLGLAICKKIVENHGGFIIADGKPNMGAVFTIYMSKNMDV